MDQVVRALEPVANDQALDCASIEASSPTEIPDPLDLVTNIVRADSRIDFQSNLLGTKSEQVDSTIRGMMDSNY
jgi:hypothetical protein